jgi:hypothetical protein
MKENIGLLGKVILAAVLMIFGAVIVGVVADASYGTTIKTIATSEVHNVLPTIATGRNSTAINATIVYTLTNAATTYGSDCPITNLVLKNSSGATFTDTTDYVADLSKGTYTLVNSAHAVATLPVANNNTYATYSYCGPNYINSTWGSSIMNMLGGFMALLLFGAAVGIMYSIYKDVTD